MISIEVSSANEAWVGLTTRFRGVVDVQPSRDQPTRELRHVVISIEDPRQRVIFARPINPAFAVVETVWVLAGLNDLSFLEFWNPRMKRYSDDGITLCGAYGHRLGSNPTVDRLQRETYRSRKPEDKPIDQLRMAYETLRKTPHSRQVVLQIWDKNLDMPNPDPRSKDVPCNLASHLLVRNNRLEWMQIMRSNDFFWGFPYNIIQFTTIQEIVSGWLGIDVGEYVHLSDSLHVYERHWPTLIRENRVSLGAALPRNLSDLRISSYEEWCQVIRRVTTHAQRLARMDSIEDLVAEIGVARSLPPAYFEWVALLAAEAMRRRGFEAESQKWIEGAGPVWTASWKRWADSRREKSPRKRTLAPIHAD